MELYQILTGYIKTDFLILIPFTWVVGKFIKKAVVSSNSNILKRIIKETQSITGVLYLIDVILGFLLGLLYSSQDGWKLFFEAFLLYGFIHGAVCCFIATKLYDKVREE